MMRGRRPVAASSANGNASSSYGSESDDNAKRDSDATAETGQQLAKILLVAFLLGAAVMFGHQHWTNRRDQAHWAIFSNP